MKSKTFLPVHTKFGVFGVKVRNRVTYTIYESSYMEPNEKCSILVFPLIIHFIGETEGGTIFGENRGDKNREKK